MLSEVFGYSPSIRYLQREAYRWEEWKELLRTELDAGYPLIYDGTNPSTKGGHAFVCDGYTPEGLFHINWGWDGSSNGYYQLSVLDDDGDGYGYSDGQGALLNIRPEQTGEKYYMRPYLTRANYSIGGNDVTVSFDVKYCAIDTHTFYIELGVVDANGDIIQAPVSKTERKMEVKEVGIYYSYSDYSSNLTLSTPLSEGQYVTLLCSADGESWEVMNTLETVPLGVNNDGQISQTEDNPDEPEQPMIVSVYWNNFDKNILKVTGLANDQSAYNNVQGISYGFSGRQTDVTLRYTITNYAEWKGHIGIYYGTDNSIQGAGAGTSVTIDDNGTFEINVARSDMEDGTYVNYMKVLSDKAGKLTYDMEVYSNGVSVFESTGHSMSFVGDVKVSFATNPIRGAVDTELPVTFSIVSGADDLVGKPLALNVSLFNTNMTTEDIQLLGLDGQEVTLGSDGSSLYTNRAVSLGALAMNTEYSLKLKSSKEIPETNNAVFAIGFSVDGKSVTPAEGGSVQLIVDPAGVSTYKVTPELTHISLGNGSVTSVTEGGECLLYLQAEDDYLLPSEITVTMKGLRLTEGEGYTYDKSNGTVTIPNVTGDIVITAEAEAMPPATYTITAPSLRNITTDIPESGLSVKQGEGATINLTAAEGFLLPETVTVKYDGTELTEGYTYTLSEDRKSATLAITSVTSNLEIHADAVAIFKVTANLTNLTADPDITQGVEVTEGETYTFTLSVASDNYNLPTDISITPATAYEYNPETGQVTIQSVMSALTITAAGVEKGHYGVVLNLDGVVAEPTSISEQFLEGTTEVSFKVTFTAEEGYVYDGAISVTMGDTPLEAETDYTYTDGTFTLLKEGGIIGTLTITAKAVPEVRYGVELDLKGVKAEPTSITDQFLEGATDVSFKVTFTAEEGYEYDGAISVTMGDTPLEAETDYTYTDGTFTLLKEEGITGTLKITAKASKVTVITEDTNVTGTADKITIQKPEEASDDEPIKVNISSVTSNSLIVDDGTSVVLKLSGANTLGDITNNGTLVIQASNGATLEGTTIENKGSLRDEAGLIHSVTGTAALSFYPIENKVVEEGKTVTLTVTATVVTNAEVSFQWQRLENGTWTDVKSPATKSVAMSSTPRTNTLTVSAEAMGVYQYRCLITHTVTNGTTISTTLTAYATVTVKEPAEPEPVTYTVTLPVVEGATITAVSATTVKEGDNFSFTITPKKGYVVTTNMVVKANGQKLTPGANGRYTITDVRSNIVVTVTGIEKDPVTAIESVDDSDLNVWAVENRLFIRTPKADKAYIVTFDGRLYNTVDLPAGETMVLMPSGAYIIYVGGQSFKLHI